MVRLVFRPYTQVRRTICTSVPLRASIRVSSDFALLRHSSPSFGSQQIRSHSNLETASRGRSMLQIIAPGCFHYALGFDTQTLAYMLDSLVRVSRRAWGQHYVNIRSTQVGEPDRPHDQLSTQRAQSLNHMKSPGPLQSVY
jgi:hypothetical protein